MTGWYDHAFGSWYLRLYPHRNQEEAARALAATDPWLPENGRILDVGCGPGRHLDILARAGRDVVGLDRSSILLANAAKHPGLRSRLVRGDMRHLPFAGESFSAVLSMFTSFGYFRTRQAHRDLLAEFARISQIGGRLVLDYLNAGTVRRTLVPSSERQIDGHRVLETRSIISGNEGDHVVKEVVVQSPAGATVDRFREEVALYDREEVVSMLSDGGWMPESILGDYDGGTWTSTSSRLLVMARRLPS